MIAGHEELNGFRIILNKLDLGNRSTPSWEEVTNFVMVHGEFAWSNNNAMDELDEELMDITEEELRIMNSYNPGYERWYGNKLDDIILGDEE